MKAGAPSRNSGSESPSSSGSDESQSVQMPNSISSSPSSFLQNLSHASTSCNNTYFNFSRADGEHQSNGPQGYPNSHHGGNPNPNLSVLQGRINPQNHQHFSQQPQDSRNYFVGGGSSGFSGMLNHGSSGSHNSHGQYNQPQDESKRKREVRLMKNREAAKECRRKKKEYIKCLENRVAVLENQNKSLIEELKGLKQLYTDKPVAQNGATLNSQPFNRCPIGQNPTRNRDLKSHNYSYYLKSRGPTGIQF